MKTAIRSAAWDKLIGSKEYRTECASVLFGTLSSFVSFPLVGQIGVNAKWHHGFCPKKLEKQPIFRRKRAVLELLGRFELGSSISEPLPIVLNAVIPYFFENSTFYPIPFRFIFYPFNKGKNKGNTRVVLHCKTFGYFRPKVLLFCIKQIRSAVVVSSPDLFYA